MAEAVIGPCHFYICTRKKKKKKIIGDNITKNMITFAN